MGRFSDGPKTQRESYAAADAQKLLVAFRLYRNQSVDLQWALHLPGEARAPSGKGEMDLFVELYDGDDLILASVNCSRPADRPPTAPYEDFQEVLPWFESAAQVAVVRDGVELARWEIEEPATASLISKPKVTETSRSDGTKAITLSWKERADARPKPYIMLRYTPDDGTRGFRWPTTSSSLKSRYRMNCWTASKAYASSSRSRPAFEQHWSMYPMPCRGENWCGTSRSASRNPTRSSAMVKPSN